MGNTPELIFVITTSIVLAIVGLFCLLCFTAFILTVIHEFRKQGRSNKFLKARKEISERERLMQKKTHKNIDSENYWNSIVGEIDKEYRGNQRPGQTTC